MPRRRADPHADKPRADPPQHAAAGGPKGRGAVINPPNRFQTIRSEADLQQLEHDDEYFSAAENPATEYLPDSSQTIVTSNHSPDVPFRYSVNPYRGCAHGCAYCYARPYHEYLGFSAGLDFETKILVKHEAPRLFREFLARPKWQPELVAFSGVTDCYQPAERKFRLTRGCLEVALEARQPVGIITKNALVCRDLDILRELAARRLVEVSLSITTLNAELARTLEPRTSTPAARLRAIGALSAAGVPVRVMTAPIIPGLNDSEIPAVLAAAAEAGARGAGYVLLRLPSSVRGVFESWLQRHVPSKKARIEALIRQTRGGEMNDPRFRSRMRGEGPYAAQIGRTFQVFAARHGLNRDTASLDVSQFRRPTSAAGQGWLFPDSGASPD